MKTKDLIEALLRVDPLGKKEVFVNSDSILDIYESPMCEDGDMPPTILVKNDNNKICGFKFQFSGNKIEITTINYEDILEINKDAECIIDERGAEDPAKVKCLLDMVNGYRDFITDIKNSIDEIDSLSEKEITKRTVSLEDLKLMVLKQELSKILEFKADGTIIWYPDASEQVIIEDHECLLLALQDVLARSSL